MSTDRPAARPPAGAPAPAPQRGWVINNARKIFAGVVIAAFWIAMRPPQVSAGLRSETAKRFHVERLPLPELPGVTYATERKVLHPSLEHCASWFSVIGAGVALADLDGDGLPNDVCHVDPRTDKVMVAPAPGTPPRYAPFALDPSPLRMDKTMVPFGCLPIDANEDGAMDLVVTWFTRTPIVFLKNGDHYQPAELVPESAGERWHTTTITSADLDGDGHLDLIAANYFPDGSHLYDPNPDSPTPVMQQSFSRAFNGGLKHLLLWKGATQGASPSVRFEEQKNVFSPEINGGWTLAIGTQDLDGDQLPEIFMANDFGPDRLMHNRSTPGHLSFAVVEGKQSLRYTHSKTLGRDSFKGMGVDFADLNGDQVPDILVTNISAQFALMEHHNAFISQGDIHQLKEGVAPYRDEGDVMGLARNSWGWDVKFADLDNDTRPEVLQALGFFHGKTNRWPELQELGFAHDELLPNPGIWPRMEQGDDVAGNEWLQFMTNIGGRYVDIAPELGLDQRQVSRGIATADVDGDGDLDYVVANQWEPSFFYRNGCAGSPGCGAFLGLHLRLPLRPGSATVERAGHPTGATGASQAAGAGDTFAVASSRPAVGAAVSVKLPDGRVLVRQADGGNGHSGRSSPDVHLGLGAVPGDKPLDVTIAYRDPAGRLHRDDLKLVPGWHTVVLGWPNSK